MAAQFEVLDQIVKYAKYLANAHNEINGFRTGTIEDIHTDSNQTYPMLAIIWPALRITPVINRNQDETLRFQFTIGVYANSVEDDNGNEVIVNEIAFPKLPNEIAELGLSARDELMQKTIRIMSHLIGQMDEDIQNGVINALFNSASFNAVNHTTTDDIYGCECVVEFTLTNPYYCDIANAFTFPNP